MSTQNIIINTVDPGEKWTYRIGSIASLAIGAAYLVIIVLYSSAGVLPMGGEARLKYLVGKTTIWWAIVGVSVLTNFLYVPVSLSLYFALKKVNRFAMLIGVAFVNLFAILENATNWTIYGALIRLSQSYAAAATESQRAAFVAAVQIEMLAARAKLALSHCDPNVRIDREIAVLEKIPGRRLSDLKSYRVGH